MPSLRSTAFAAAAVAALVLSPVANAGNGHGNGGGGGNGNGGGNGGNKHAVSSNASGTGETTVHGNGNAHAKLAGLNSLNRNINGLMNSSDPRLEGIRAFVEAGEDLAIAEANLAAATDALAAAQDLYDDYVDSFGLTPYAGDTSGFAYTDTSLGALQDRLDALNDIVALDPTNTDAAAEAAALDLAIQTISTSSELTTLSLAQTDVDTYTGEVAAGEAATSDDALTAALLVAANDNRVAEYGDDYVDAAMLTWAREQLGMTE